MSRTIEYRCSHCDREVRGNPDKVPGVSGWCRTEEGWTNKLSSLDSGLYICNTCAKFLAETMKKFAEGKWKK